MTEAQRNILEIVKLRMSITDNKLDALVLTYIQEIENKIIVICNIKEVPSQLTFTWASIVIDVLRLKVAYLEEVENSTPVDIKVGSTSTSTKSSSSSATVDSVVNEYMSELLSFRRLRW